MAYKESETLQANTPYSLDKYSFNCIFDDSPTLGTYARASMTKDGQTVYKTVSLPNNSKISGWTVEANDDTADVYAVIEIPVGGSEVETDFDITPNPFDFGDTSRMDAWHVYSGNYRRSIAYDSMPGVLVKIGSSYQGSIFASSVSGQTVKHDMDVYFINSEDAQGKTIEELARSNLGSFLYNNSSTYNLTRTYTYNGKTVYYVYLEGGLYYTNINPVTSGLIEQIAWASVYGKRVDPDYEVKEILIGRFAIELEDAGGVGPGSDWTDPGDYDPDWEEGDPTHTLYVEVTGALSGRHNDPIEDPSYSYIPADKDTVKDYGCGGDGGHGGGGGAGASTVVIHKFATNQANSKEVTAIARRHGYGSGGGKGGKGGDGCILVYY